MSTNDLDDMADLLGDPRVMEYYPRPKSRDEAGAWIDWNLRNYADHGHGLWIIETHDGEFIGDCGLTWQKLDDSVELEVGYHVKTSAQNLGYAAEAAAACRDFARSRALAARLIAIIHQDNLASQRVAEKTGMRVGLALHHSSPIHLVYVMNL
ncbi:MAG: GNAT family N-acetyltransferase [Brevibacterium sp.]|nr:GNAT family N-acetyltransferase [Brevibacterium sp.]